MKAIDFNLKTINDLADIYSNFENPLYPCKSEEQKKLMDEFNSYFVKKNIPTLEWNEYGDNEVVCQILEPHIYTSNGVSKLGSKYVMRCFLSDSGDIYFDDGSPNIITYKSIKEIAKEFITYLKYRNFK